MDTFGLTALEEGYGFNVGNNVREQQLEGGMPRQVIKFVGAVHSVTATVLIQNDQARQYFWAFWRKNQTKEFLWKLAVDNGGIEECICRFNNQGIPSLSLIRAYVWKASITIYVKPIKRNSDSDESIVNLWGGIDGGDPFEIEKIPNVYFPDATGV